MTEFNPIRWGSDDKIDGFTHRFLKDVFDFEYPHSSWFSHETPLRRYLQDESGKYPIQPEGHTQMLYSQVPLDDRSLYPIDPDILDYGEDSLVWYPPITKGQEAELISQLDSMARKCVEERFGFSIDSVEPLNLGVVVDFVGKELVKRATNL